MIRITVEETQFITELSVNSKLWNTKGDHVSEDIQTAIETNRLLNKMRVSINRAHQKIMDRDNFATTEKVKIPFSDWSNAATDVPSAQENYAK